MQYEEFLRVYAVRAPNLMWFLGAGTSASAGIPTASALIWQFKRTLYCAAQHVSVKSCEDLSSASVRGKLQAYFDAIGTFPPENSPDEYAFYFESTYGDAADRRAVIDKYVSGASPTWEGSNYMDSQFRPAHRGFSGEGVRRHCEDCGRVP